MFRTQLIISYRGTRYVGWQRQPNGLAVQQVVEEALAKLLGTAPRLVAAGRTDAGVHALGQSVHFDHDRELPERAWVEGANRFLPDDIRILAAKGRPQEFHARYKAVSKEYRYLVSTASVIDALEYWRRVGIQADADFDAMNRAAQELVGCHDFTAFALAGGAHKSPERTVTTAAWTVDEAKAEFVIRGNGFLRGMVRSIVGTLLEVGSGSRSVDEFAALLAGRPRGDAGQTAPAKGLVLQKVEY